MDAVSHQMLPKTVDMSVPVAMADGKHDFEAVATASDGRILSKGADIYIWRHRRRISYMMWRAGGLCGLIWTV